MEALDHALVDLKPDSMKGYTIGDNTDKDQSRYPWRLDDEKLVYPAYEKMLEAGVVNVCIHKGLFPPSLDQKYPNLRPYCDVRDVGKAAKDWPCLNFIIYADLGQLFALTTVAQPRVTAAMMGMLVRGLGADHVIWGTDAVWTGAPQWQIEGLRRLEIPEDMQKKHGFAPTATPSWRAPTGSRSSRRNTSAGAPAVATGATATWSGAEASRRPGAQRPGPTHTQV
jgi:uncharacterized protein